MLGSECDGLMQVIGGEWRAGVDGASLAHPIGVCAG